jgi:hypothetical protein
MGRVRDAEEEVTGASIIPGMGEARRRRFPDIHVEMREPAHSGTLMTYL